MIAVGKQFPALRLDRSFGFGYGLENANPNELAIVPEHTAPFLGRFMPIDATNPGPLIVPLSVLPMLRVLLVRNRSKVAGVDASPVVADVIKKHSIADVPDHPFISQSVHVFVTALKAELSVSPARFRAVPFPA
nr:hypothetical protein [Arthrobacter sp. AG1021]